MISPDKLVWVAVLYWEKNHSNYYWGDKHGVMWTEGRNMSYYESSDEAAKAPTTYVSDFYCDRVPFKMVHHLRLIGSKNKINS